MGISCTAHSVVQLPFAQTLKCISTGDSGLIVLAEIITATAGLVSVLLALLALMHARKVTELARNAQESAHQFQLDQLMPEYVIRLMHDDVGLSVRIENLSERELLASDLDVENGLFGGRNNVIAPHQAHNCGLDFQDSEKNIQFRLLPLGGRVWDEIDWQLSRNEDGVPTVNRVAIGNEIMFFAFGKGMRRFYSPSAMHALKPGVVGARNG